MRGQCAPIVIGHVCEAGGQEVARRMPAALEGIAEPEPYRPSRASKAKGGCFIHVEAVYQMAAGPTAGEQLA